jgi:hypothetical protein
MEMIFTPDEWPRARAALRQHGIEHYTHLRYDLNNPHAGWLPVAAQLRQAAVELPIGPVAAASATQRELL